MRIIVCIIFGIFFTSVVNAAEFNIKSTSFKDNDKIPVVYTCDGKNKSPELSWTNPPANTQSFALLLSSPDAHIGETYYGWVLYNIPPSVKELAEDAEDDLPEGALVGNTTLGDAIYRGPCPPNEGTHHYVFTIYALDRDLNLSSESDVSEVLTKMKHHILGQTQITATYSH